MQKKKRHPEETTKKSKGEKKNTTQYSKIIVPMKARIIGIQDQALFQKCVEAGEYMRKEHKWSVDVVRNFEYQYHQERAALISAFASSSSSSSSTELASEAVLALVVDNTSPPSPGTTKEQQQPQLLSGDDFLSLVSSQSDFKMFDRVPDSDPDSYLSLARKSHRAFLRSTGCSFAWMLIKQGGTPIGRLVFQLFSEKAPRTSQNFLYLCRGDLPDVKNVTVPHANNFTGDVKLSYQSSKVFRVVKDGWIQAGDIVGNKKGNSGYCIYGESMPTETIGVVDHDSMGVLGMSWGPGPDGVGGPHTSASSFYITLGPSAWMNKGYCSFGRVVSGMHVVKALGEVKTHHSQAPVDDIIIAEAGEVNTDP